MKKLFLLLVMLIFSTSVYAKNVKVEAMSDFSTVNPPEFWSVKIVDGFMIEDYPVYAGSVVKGKIESVADPKRLKRNANFTFIPTDYYDYKTQQWYEIKRDFSGKYSSLTDVSAKSIAKTGAVAVGNKLVDGFFGPSVALVEGSVKNEKGNRAKSAVVSVYESTPISYVNKGKELEIKQGQIFVMSFKKQED